MYVCVYRYDNRGMHRRYKLTPRSYGVSPNSHVLYPPTNQLRMICIICQGDTVLLHFVYVRDPFSYVPLNYCKSTILTYSKRAIIITSIDFLSLSSTSSSFSFVLRINRYYRAYIHRNPLLVLIL